MTCKECKKEIASGSTYVMINLDFYHGICGLIKKNREQKIEWIKEKKEKKR